MRFWVGADHSDEGLGEDGEGDVAVPAQVGAAFEVVQSQAGLELAVVVLDPPSDLGQAHQLFQGDVFGQGGQPVAGGLVGLGRPFGQQPAGGQAAVGGEGDVAAGGPDPGGQDPGTQVQATLDAVRMAGTEVTGILATPVGILIALTVCLYPGSDPVASCP